MKHVTNKQIGLSTDWTRVQEMLEEYVKVLHQELGWFNDEEVEHTPRRITDFYKEWYYNQNYRFTCFEKRTDQMVILRDISFFSMCSHHVLPFYGKCHIGYLPEEKLCGVSKLARVVRHISSKPQMQEIMTGEIVDYLFEQLQPLWVMVIVEGIHTCMVGRGVREPESVMITSAIRKDNRIRSPVSDEKSSTLKNEFMSLVLNRGSSL